MPLQLAVTYPPTAALTSFAVARVEAVQSRVLDLPSLSYVHCTS